MQSSITTLASLLAGSLLFTAATGHAGVDTATKLRIESIEARLPDVNRLERVETRLAQLSSDASSESGSGQPSNMFGLLRDLQVLQEEVRQLRGDVDQIEFELNQAKQRERDLYQDIDARLQALESGGGGVGNNVSSGNDPVDEAAAEKAYLAAREQLANSNYTAAAQAFEAVIKNYPGSQYIPAAWYWMGEAHYVDRRYAEAEKALSTVTQQYADSDKAADALYRLGVVYDEQGKTDQARQALGGVSEKYPGTRAAEKASERLRAIGG